MLEDSTSQFLFCLLSRL